MSNQEPRYSELPEVVPPENLPEAVVSRDAPEVAKSTLPQLAQAAPYDGLHPASSAEATAVTPSEKGKRRLFGWSKRRLWAVITIVVVAIIAIVVGVTVGVLTQRDGSSENDDSDDTQNNNTPPTEKNVFGTPTSFSDAPAGSTSVCSGTVCPSVLAAATPDGDSTVTIFGLGANKEYWYRETDGERWKTDWKSLGGGFSSQPAAISSSAGRIDVFGVWDSDRTMRTKSYWLGTWNAEWRNLQGRCFSPPVLCPRGEGKFHVWTQSNLRELAWKSYVDDEWDPMPNAGWRRDNGISLNSSAAVACDTNRMDISAYNTTGRSFELVTKRLNGTVSSSWEPHGGDFQGAPVLALSDQGKTHFLGVGADGSMYYGSWQNRIPTKLDDGDFLNIGGSFQSVPSVLVRGPKRLDVLAVGTDGRLKQKALVDEKWAQDWQDLGGFFNSAPLVVELPGKSHQVAVFGIGSRGDIIHGIWKIGDASAWKDGGWFSDGGNFSTSWLQADPKLKV